MKKLLVVLLAILFGVAIGFGQHIDVVNQTGNTNQANVTQGFDPSPGPGLPGNQAFVDQIGNDNKATILQFNNGYAGSGEFAKIYQQGGENQGTIAQENDGHQAFITQYQWNNVAAIQQFGNKTLGTIIQNGHANQGFMNIYGVAPGPVTGTISQVGNDNKSWQDLGQAGAFVSGSSFAVSQNGILNWSKQYMEGKGFPGSITAVGNQGTVVQTGSENIADQEMFIWPAGGTDANNVGVILQTGGNDYAKQTMFGTGNASTILQTGNGNVAVSLQN